MHNSDDKLAALLNSALAADSIYKPSDCKREADLTPEKRARGRSGRGGAASARAARSAGNLSDRRRHPLVAAVRHSGKRFIIIQF
jgi:hypothetical protein